MKICRQVDGIPLAIELVAARLGVQTIDDLALQLDDYMRIHSIGGRAAQPRHRTLAATLDWSLALLNEDELRLFRRLSAFRGHFDVESALGISVDKMDPKVAFDALISLASKSLVSFDAGHAAAPYRLLDTTRSYAQRQLVQSQEWPSVVRRHARLMLDVMVAANAELPVPDMRTWIDRHSHRLGDVRFALDTCFACKEDMGTGAALTVASAPLWFQLSQFVEFRDRALLAMNYLCAQEEPDRDMTTRLQMALGHALWHTAGAMPEMTVSCEEPLSGALDIRMPDLQGRSP
jgi:predicted ATPase